MKNTFEESIVIKISWFFDRLFKKQAQKLILTMVIQVVVTANNLNKRINKHTHQQMTAVENE
jgi:hypothetical protein